jgi:tetratricopeptide (TPR) repeat protein
MKLLHQVSMTAVRLLAVLILVAPLLAQETEEAREFEKLNYFGVEFFKINDHASALEQFVKADALQPDHPVVLYNMALLFAKIGRFSEAQVKVDRYVQLYPTGGAEAQLVKELQFKLEFERERQRSRRIEQEYTDLFTKGRFLYGRNELDSALQLFTEAEQRRRNEPAAVFNQAVVYEKLGDFEKAAERYRRYLELESDTDQKGAIDQHIVSLEGELADIRTKIVCSFCGHRLPVGATWCHRCWHGPYLTSSPIWSSRPCLEGASATRATFFPGDRFNKNESLPCMYEGSMREALRYSPSRRQAIQEARKSEGWSYAGEVIQSWRDREGSEIRYVQGAEYLERIDSETGGEILTYTAHRDGEFWLLDREEWFIDGQKYTSYFTFDAEGRIARQRVEYQNTSACNHNIVMTADYRWEENRLLGVNIGGGYDGFVAEGAPRTDWEVSIVNTFDDLGRISKEDLTVGSMTKTYSVRPAKGERATIALLYPTMRLKRPMTDLAVRGDFCAISGGRYIANLIDLRPFYAISPSLAFPIPNGVTRAVVTYVYPAGYKP